MANNTPKKPSPKKGKPAIKDPENTLLNVSKEGILESQQPTLFEKGRGETINPKKLSWQIDEDILFNPEQPIYLQINAGNLYRFFASALISPHNSSSIEAFPDVQSINATVLLLSNGFLAVPEEESVLLELVLTRGEIEQMEVCRGIAVLRHPLPISRIFCILVQNESIKREIFNTSLSADGGIIPEQLFSICGVTKLVRLPNEKWTENNHSEKSNHFDRILGVFAFLANYSILMANRSNVVKTLPDHFFIAASTIDQNYPSPLDGEKVSGFYKILFEMNRDEQPLLQWLVKRMFAGSNFTDADVVNFSTIMSEYGSKAFLSESRNVLMSLMKSLERKSAIRSIPGLKQNDKFYLYLLAMLRTYGNINSEDKSISRADLPELIFPNYGEYSFACLGYFYGYKLLRNFEDRLKIDDKLFSDLLETEKRKNLKFRLDTEFDLRLIESIYQYAFNGKHGTDSLDFKRFHHLIVEPVRQSTHLSNRYSVKEETIMGRVVYAISKLTYIQEIEHLLTNIDVIPAISVLGARCYRSGIQIQSTRLIDFHPAKLNYAFYFLKSDILKAIQTGKINSEEVLKDIKFGRTEKEFS